MRRFDWTYLVIVALVGVAALLLSAPCWANMIVVSKSHPTSLVPNLPDYTVAVSSDGSSIKTALQSATTHGDTVYVDSGSYDERIVNTDWRAAYVTLIGAQDLTTEIRPATAATEFLDTLAIGRRGYAYRGSLVKWIRIDGDGHNGHGFSIATAESSTVYGCVAEGNLKTVIIHGGGIYTSASDGANRATVQACSLSSTRTANSTAFVVVATGGSIASADSVTFTGNTHAWANASVTSQGIELRGVTNFLWEDDIVLPQTTTGGSYGFGIWSEAPSQLVDGLTFRDCTITSVPIGGTATDIVTISLGKVLGSANAIVDNVTLERVRINVPPINNHFGFKAEADYNGAVGDDDSYSDNINLIDVLVTGGRTGLGFHENTRNSSMVRCRIIGPGDIATSGYQTFGIVIEDARHIRLIDNWVSNVEKGLSLSHSGNLTPANGFHNYDVFSGGNVFENCAKGVNYQYYESANTVTTDSLFVSQGDLFVNVGTVGYLDDAASPTGDLDLAAFKARPIIAGSETGSQNDAYGWTHGAGCEEYTGDVVAAVKRNGAIPYGFHRVLGARSAGLRR